MSLAAHAAPQPSALRAVRTRPALDPAVLSADDAWVPWLDQLAWAFVGLAIVLRVGRYLLCFPFWQDELMLAENFLDRGYLDLLRPLDLHQVAPIGYLWIELTAVKLFGFSEWSLRLFSIVSSMVGIFLFRDLAARLLGQVAMVLTVGVFAVSYYLIRYATECKPYGSDLTLSLLLVLLAVRWWQDQSNRRWLWGLTIAGPLCITISYPVVFVAGGVSIALAWTVWQTQDRRVWLAFVTYNVVLSGTFLCLLQLVSSKQYAVDGDFMVNYWADSFPSSRPLELIQWFLYVHAGEMMAYPIGDDHYGSTLTLVCFVVAIVTLVRCKEHTIAALVLAPLVLAFVAAALRRYPYGGPRAMQYYAPLACLMAGFGATCLIGWIGREDVRRRAFGITVTALLVVGMATLARDMSHPFKELEDLDYRGFARWFWKECAAEGELVCVQTDLSKNFFGVSPHEHYYYRCYQRAYSPLHHQGPLAVSQVNASPTRPIQYVVFCQEGDVCDQEALSAWLAETSARYEFMNKQSYHIPLPGLGKNELGHYRCGCYTVYQFRANPELVEMAERNALAPATRR